MVLALLFSLIPISSSYATVSFDSFTKPVTHGKVIKYFLLTPLLQELLRGKTENKNVLEQGPLTISMHEITNLFSACLVNCMWCAYANNNNQEFADVVKHTFFGEAVYKALITLGKAVGFNQSLSYETRKRVSVLVAPFLKEVFAAMVKDTFN